MAALNIPITPSQWEHRDKNYTGVQFQEGTPVLAKELNYFQQISGYTNDSLFRSILGPMFLGDAFKVTAVAADVGNENSISIKAGKFYCPLGEVVCESDKRYTDIVNLDHYDNDAYVKKATWDDDSFETYSNDISTPTTPKRTDLVILVITRVNIDSFRDSGIIDTALGSETATRLKLYYTLKYVKGGTLGTWESSFTYEDPGVFRLPIAVINRTNTNDFIYQSQIVDQRSYAAEVMAVPMYKKVTNYIASQQGHGNGFNADTVDNRHVNDLLDDIYSLWSASKIKQFVSDTAKGLIPQTSVDEALPAGDINDNAADGYRVLCLAEDIAKPTFKLDYIYEYSLSLEKFVETEPQQGFLLQVTADQVFVLYSELALDPPDPDYGSHWFNFGGINDHATLNSVLKADDTSTENTVKKHVTDLQMKTIVDRITATEGIANTVTSDLSTHRLAATLDHPANSVLDSHIAALTVDPALVGTSNTARLTTLLSNIATALKTINGSANWYTGVLKANLGGDTFTGDVRVPKLGIGQAVGTEVLEVTGNIKASGNITSSGSIGASISNTTDTGVVTTNHLRQVNASIDSTASGHRSEVNASDSSTASGVRSQVNASTDSTASGDRSQVNASSNSTASGDKSQVNASEYSTASGDKSQVNASFQSAASGDKSQVNASTDSTASGDRSQVNASIRTINNTYFSTVWGYAVSGEPSE